MPTEPAGGGRNAEIIPLRAVDAQTETGLDEASPPAYLDTTDDTTGQRLPIIPEHWRRANIRGTLTQAAGLWWHRSRYHGLRCPAYLARLVFYTARGGHRVTLRLLTWWHWTDGWLLESMAVAAGRAGHQEAMRAHTEGKKTRGARGRIIGVSALATVVAGLMMARWSPWWGWALLGLAVVVPLARAGKPHGKPLIGAAVVPPAYQPPTPEVITRALGSLNLAGINQALKDGPGINFVSDVHRDGPGWGCQLDLPYGVTATQILARREQLASGLRRPLSATWPAPVPHEHAGRLELWVGFHDISKAKPSAWPLAKTGQADAFAAFPFGTDPRGRQVAGQLFEHNWLIGAAPGQGKTSAVRVVACSAALDPLVELWTHEQAGKGDLEPLAQVSHRYVSGLDDESIAYAAESLRMLRAELDTRSRKLKAIPKESRPDGKVTRAMAARRSMRLFPLVAIFDEVQNVFMHDKHGAQAAEDAAYVIRLGRAYGVILVLATQRPDTNSLPTSVSGNVSIRFCLKVPGQVENDMILGTSAYKNGYNAAVFRPKVDAGLGWLRAEGDPQVVRTYYLDLEATGRIAERARVLRGQAGTLTGYALGEEDTAEARDVLADLTAVFRGDPGLHWGEAAARLAAAFPGRWDGATADALSAEVRARGVPSVPVKTGGEVARGCRRADVEKATAR
jgi:DNA segregation ATPase FtsK/SpoIIIE, S-DNA-T family